MFNHREGVDFQIWLIMCTRIQMVTTAMFWAIFGKHGKNEFSPLNSQSIRITSNFVIDKIAITTTAAALVVLRKLTLLHLHAFHLEPLVSLGFIDFSVICVLTKSAFSIISCVWCIFSVSSLRI